MPAGGDGGVAGSGAFGGGVVVVAGLSCEAFEEVVFAVGF